MKPTASPEPSPAEQVTMPPAPPFDPAQLPPALRDHSRYRIVRKLGEGGMGVVYQAEHRVMERPVAIKVISRTLVGNAEAIERFNREVRAAAKLDHPNIVKAYDAEQAGDLQLLAMEFIEGISLTDVLATKGPLPIANACHYIRQAALGLQHAHEKGMVHRDLKPSNLVLSRKGVVKILDFGLAKLLDDRNRSAALTVANVMMGTPEYVAPEQALDTKNADIRADIYSLGCTLFCLLAGRPPFRAPDGEHLKVVMSHIETPPPPITDYRPDVPPELAALIARMLAKSPDQRPQTPKEVAEALLPFAKPKAKTPPLRVPIAVAPTLPPAAADATTFAGLGSTPVNRRTRLASRRPAWLIPVAAGVGGLLVVFVLWASGVFKPRRALPPDANVSASGGNNDATESVTTRPIASATPPATEVTNSIGLRLRYIPPGEFWMGSGLDDSRTLSDERPQHQVRISQGFYLGVFEVTQEEYRKVIGINPSHFSPDGPGKNRITGLDWKRLPVEQVTLYDAIEFCRQLTDLPAEKTAGRVYRLPTEAEWEYACRGGNATVYPVGPYGLSVSSHQANFNGNYPHPGDPRGPWLERTAEVGSYSANGFGLYDMAGNVWEWCADRKRTYTIASQVDPRGPDTGTGINRGGGWISSAHELRCAHRRPDNLTPADRHRSTGLRAVMTSAVPDPVERPAEPIKPAEGFVSLFNGKDLTGWQSAEGGPPPDGWLVKDGVISRGAARSDLWTKDRFSDFVLELEYKTDGNSGIFIRSQNPRDRFANALEVQIDRPLPAPNKESAGAIFMVAAPSRENSRADDWNAMVVTARSSRIEVMMNAQVILSANLDNWTIAGKNPDGTPNRFKVPVRDLPRSGHIGLQAHIGQVQFRSIRINRLGASAVE